MQFYQHKWMIAAKIIWNRVKKNKSNQVVGNQNDKLLYKNCQLKALSNSLQTTTIKA